MFSAEDLNNIADPEADSSEAKEYADLIQAHIASLKAKLEYPPAVRMGILGGLVGTYFGGVTGTAVGALGGFLLGNKQKVEGVEREVILNQIAALQDELRKVAASGELTEGEISGIMNSQELMNYSYDCYTFQGKWHDLIGDPGKRFHMMVFGRPKQGKSIFCVQFANYFSQNFGRVLYVAAEEGFSVTLQKKIREFGMANNNMDFANYRNYEQIRAALQAKPYKLVFIDSVNFIKITPEQIEELKAENPQTAFVTVQQATKGGQFRGSQEYAHNCDIIIEVIAGTAHQQGRYQVHSEMPIFDGPEAKAKDKKETLETVEVSDISPEFGQMELF
jgi:hypothetical protein